MKLYVLFVLLTTNVHPITADLAQCQSHPHKVEMNGLCYAQIDAHNPGTLAQSEALCAADGGHLAVIPDEATEIAVYNTYTNVVSRSSRLAMERNSEGIVEHVYWNGTRVPVANWGIANWADASARFGKMGGAKKVMLRSSTDDTSIDGVMCQYGDPCVGVVCENGGTCVAAEQSAFVCHCHDAFSGELCQTAFEPYLSRLREIFCYEHAHVAGVKICEWRFV